MEKKLVYSLRDNGDLKGLICENLDTIKDWIEADIESNLDEDEIKEREYTITMQYMTQEEIDNLPEYEG